MKVHYTIDLRSTKPDVRTYGSDLIKQDLELFELEDPMDLGTFDHRIFKNEREADNWLVRYEKIKCGLDNKKICKSRDLPALLYKRRYMIQTIMGDKLHTIRDYVKNWQPGQFFNLHDQTYFLTVQLTKLSQVDDQWRYDFKLP